MAEDKEKSQEKVPPYISAATFFNALASLVEHGVPQQIDRSVLSKFSGGVQRQLILAFSYLGLIDDEDRPTERLKSYEKADVERRKTILQELIQQHFPRQVSILPDGTLQQLQSSFSEFEIEPSVRAKCIAFLLNTAKRIGLPVGKHIAKSSRVRGTRKVIKIKSKPVEPKKKLKNEEDDDLKVPTDKVAMPIAIGPGKTWRIIVDKTHSKEDAGRFIQMIGIVLGVQK